MIETASDRNRTQGDYYQTNVGCLVATPVKGIGLVTALVGRNAKGRAEKAGGTLSVIDAKRLAHNILEALGEEESSTHSSGA